MVAKINIGSNLYGALAYNQEKVDEGQGKVLAAHLVREPIDGSFHVSACAEDFERWLPSHFRTEKPIIHISLNPHPDDRLTDDQLANIGREYMESLGYGGQPYLIFKHEDIEREHIHIVSLRVKSDGKKINDSKEHERSKAITEDIERRYGLHPAEGKKQGEQWELTPVDPKRSNLKRQIAAVIRPAMAMYHFQSIGEYKALLSLYRVGVEEIRGEVKGKPYRGLVYAALNADGSKIGTPLKSSLFGKSVGFDALDRRLSRSGEQLKQHEHKEKMRELLVDAMGASRCEGELRAKLKERGVDLVLRRNDQGRIYGATFIDHNNRCVFNGSRLGKEFSASTFNERFGGDQKVGEELRGIFQVQKNKNAEKSSNHPPASSTGVSEAIGSILSFLSPEPENNPKEEMPFPRRRKKKKRRYGRQM